MNPWEVSAQEAGAGDVGKLANGRVVETGTETLRRIVDDPQPFGLGKTGDGGKVCRLAEQPDTDDADKIDTGSFGGFLGGRQAAWVQIERHRIYFGENRYRTQNRHHFGACGKGEGRNDDPLARPQTLCQQCQDERIGSR